MKSEIFLKEGDLIGITFKDKNPIPVEIVGVKGNCVDTVRFTAGNLLNVVRQDSLQYPLPGGFKKILEDQIGKND